MSSSRASEDPALRDREGLASWSATARDSGNGNRDVQQAEETPDIKGNQPPPSRTQCDTAHKGGFDDTLPASYTAAGTENRLNGKPGNLQYNHSTPSSEHAPVSGRRSR